MNNLVESLKNIIIKNKIVFIKSTILVLGVIGLQVFYQ